MKYYFFLAWLLVGLLGCRQAEQRDIYYQIFIRSFADSNADGIGDLRGITRALGYLDSLGVAGIWLTPFHPSPSYHKYDVVDYRNVDPEYGTLEDFRELVQAAHDRGIKVLVDLVANHTSEQHPWFQEALKGPDNPYRNYYVWAHPDSIREERHLWHGEGDEKYYGFFWKGMPDLNYDNPRVREEMKAIARFWLEDMKADGFRLDAALHIYSFYNSNRAAHLQKTVDWWEEFHAETRCHLVGEVWEGDSVLARFKEGALDHAFHFDLAAWIIGTVNSGRDTFDLARRLAELEQPPGAIFLSNHDQNRVYSQLGNDPKKATIASSILLTLPGRPYLYYGEELGLQGVKPDEQIRQPFPWTLLGRPSWQTSWQPLVSPVDTSLLEHYRHWIRVRNQNPALAEGKIEPWDGPPYPEHYLVYYRTHPRQKLLVIHDLQGGTTEIK